MIYFTKRSERGVNEKTQAMLYWQA